MGQESRDPGSIERNRAPWLRTSLTVSSARCWPLSATRLEEPGATPSSSAIQIDALMIILPEMGDEEFVLPVDLREHALHSGG